MGAPIPPSPPGCQAKGERRAAPPACAAQRRGMQARMACGLGLAAQPRDGRDLPRIRALRASVARMQHRRAERHRGRWYFKCRYAEQHKPALAGEPIKSSQANAGGEMPFAHYAGNTRQHFCEFGILPCSPLAAAHPYVGSRQRRTGHAGSANGYDVPVFRTRSPVKIFWSKNRLFLAFAAHLCGM